MEVNLLGFIILLVNNNNNERSLKYFLIQSLRSVILIRSALLTENFSSKNLQLLIILALLLKLGTAPLHFWLPIITENLTNYQLIFLLTWQKLAPLYLIFTLPFQNITVFFAIRRLLVGALGSLNELRIYSLLTYSSINHTGWILLTMLSNEIITVLYLVFYTIMVSIVLLPINSKSSQSTWLIKNSNKYLIFINLLSLAGLPPFAGFIIKWILLSQIFMYLNIIINMVMILTSIILLYFYLRISMNRFFKNSTYLLNFIKVKNENIYAFRLLNITTIFILLIYVSSI
jgi:NADH:ubiquinone oxidoreductase subunit 2 (subunit N)